MTKDRQFAVEVVKRLRDAGHEALWAGGCVRDSLLNKSPKDYDVATSALPDQVRALFGRRRTIPVGAAFGVIAVIDGQGQQIEVATFRQDAQYSDGRHPDSVQFSTAEEDAARRDFTINGMFFDPIREEVIDYVGGQRDLQERLVRAIGVPEERIDEDKLRMLRAVRFAATFDFEIEAATMAAVQNHAEELRIVSVERILAELRLMLVHPQRGYGLRLLVESRLLAVILPEAERSLLVDKERLGETHRALEAAESPAFAVAFAILLRGVLPNFSAGLTAPAQAICRRLKSTNDELATVLACAKCESIIMGARQLPWHRVQRALILKQAADVVSYCAAISRDEDARSAVEWCRAKLALPSNELNPPPLVDGNQLRTAGIPVGPLYRTILDRIRDAQLDGEIQSTEEAMALARELVEPT